jgi:histidinol dehydrogenase
VSGPDLELAARGPLEELSPELRSRIVDRTPDDEPGVRETVRGLLQEVREAGDEALRDQVRRFDGVELQHLEIPRERWREALESLDPAVRGALERAARNIDAFHRALIPDEVEIETEPGVRLGRRFVPLDAVGVYAPGGRAAYPSSVLMGVVPARAAGVQEIVVCSPPGPSGEPPASVLAAALLGGATRLVAVGGAGAVGAMAWGTASVPRCDAIVGPGNRWVLEAKRQVAGEVVIDSPAGPSEVLVVADATSDPARNAAELVAQAEHDPDAAVVLVTWDADVLDATSQALDLQVASTPRKEVVESALAARGALLLARDRDEALDFADAWAAEHLALYTDDPAGDLERIRTAGTVVLGNAATVAHGDYLTGANHVLPTAGTARSFSGLSTLHFMRSYTWQEVSPAGAEALAQDLELLAEAEGLPAHGSAAAMRAAAPTRSETGEASGPGHPGEAGTSPEVVP